MNLDNFNESGIVLYDIELDGCLNGVFTNEFSKGQIYNEIARKKNVVDSEKTDDSLIGEYNCYYFDPVGHVSELTIQEKNGPSKLPKVYAFSWRISGKTIFHGTGYKMNEKQIVVHYWMVS